jgi:hypothetical protein
MQDADALPLAGSIGGIRRGLAPTIRSRSESLGWQHLIADRAWLASSSNSRSENGSYGAQTHRAAEALARVVLADRQLGDVLTEITGIARRAMRSIEAASITLIRGREAVYGCVRRAEAEAEIVLLAVGPF